MQTFLKWPGGKRWLIAKYQKIFPTKYNVYFEPFLGGASTFFYLNPKKSYLSDINQDLINTFNVMSSNPKQLRDQLIEHQKKHNKEYYYLIRDSIAKNHISQAAKFLYLNRTCFNGMYRVNNSGKFNVPIGTKKNFVDDIELFEKYAEILQNAKIIAQDFEITINKASHNDFIFIDPPYTIAHNQNSFIKYNENLFSWKDQIRLLKTLTKARDRGALIIATNANYPDIEKMYRDKKFFTQPLERYSSISGKTKGRKIQEELLISSYPINIMEG